MCLAADIPLIESGTTGFNGQVQIIKRGRTECYDCNPKDSPKSYPVCTIRSTPSQPIHCIVWAKSYLFSEIFGTSEHDSPELDASESSDNAEEIEKLRDEAQALKRIRESMGSDDFPRRVFDKVFREDIERLRGMKDMWKSRGKPPDPLNFDGLSEQALGVGDDVCKKDQTVWTAAENFAVFSSSLGRLSNRLDDMRAQNNVGNATPVMTFDKDDKDILDFVAASANLRSIVFQMEPKSEFDVKRKLSRLQLMVRIMLICDIEMAGNIIPAIATTNAMIASLCVFQAFKILREDYDRGKMMFLSQSVDRLISSASLQPPNPQCPVCGVAQSRVEVDLSSATLQNLVEDVLRLQLGYGEEMSVRSDAGILYDPDLDDNLSKKLGDLNIKNDSFVTVTDESDEAPRMDLVLAVDSKESSDPPISLPEKPEIGPKPRAPEETNGRVDVQRLSNGLSGTKRKRDADDADLEADIASKRGKAMEENPRQESKSGKVLQNNGTGDNSTIVVEDDSTGAIVIDD